MTRYRGLLLCSTAVLLTFGVASQAATPASIDTAPALAANSYADLLAPIPNATALLEADNLARAQQVQKAPEATFQLAYHHHHHHHYRHHHHHTYFPWGVFVAPPPSTITTITTATGLGAGPIGMGIATCAGIFASAIDRRAIGAKGVPGRGGFGLKSPRFGLKKPPSCAQHPHLSGHFSRCLRGW